MKTVAQIVSEYKKQRANPEYKMITVVGADGVPLTRVNVKNIEKTKNNGIWLEFDSMPEYATGIEHIKVLNGKITKYITKR